MAERIEPSTLIEQQAQWYADTIDLYAQVLVDVGANAGALATALWKVAGPRCTLHAIEPLAENIAKIRAGMPEGAAWTLHEAACSDHDGTLEVRVEDEGPSGFNCRVLDHGSPGDRSVRVARLVTLVPEATVVKIDVEGHEYTILDDALESMPNVAAWAIEFHRVAGRPLPDALGSLAAHGYTLLAAGRKRSDPHGAWISAEIPPTLSWDAIPVAKRNADGSAFKMLHVIARRR